MTLKNELTYIISIAVLGLTLLSAGCQSTIENRDLKSASSTWYVQKQDSTANSTSNGTRSSPFHSLVAVQKVSRPGDTIRILPSPINMPPLDGTLLMKEGQILEGISEDNRKPQITNSDADNNHGDTITLADRTIVRNLHIVSSAGHAVVGRNVNGVTVENNWIQGGNQKDLTSVTTGATASLGVPKFPKGLITLIHNAQIETTSTNYVVSNTINGITTSDGNLLRLNGAGVSVHVSGNNQSTLFVTKNRISDLGSGFQRSGILIDTQNDARLSLIIEDSHISNAHNSSDGIILIAQNQSLITGAIRRYEYSGGNTPGGVGNNGLEVVTYSGGNWLKSERTASDWHSANTRLILENSTIRGSDGFGIAFFNLFGKPSKNTVLDFGGGELGGKGNNRFFNNGKALPRGMDIYVVHQDINLSNNWWGTNRRGESKTELVEGELALKREYAFVCPGTPKQLEVLIEHTGVGAWSTFCQAFNNEICGPDPTKSTCCDPSSDPSQCLETINDNTVVFGPALSDDP